ncbi:Alpha/Beta hydrolase protein [Panaeolus papilionaceus]|nr:Alpha/Beta hydrolase protein [Panaeolus papilionaceus]
MQPHMAFISTCSYLQDSSGSKRNWGSLCKALHRDLPDRPIYTLDLRNHGTSPHATPMTYSAMAADVLKFIEDKKLQDVALLGHSMGGKAAMAYALHASEAKLSSEYLSKLIVVDIAPSVGKISPEFQQYVIAMQQIEALEPGKVNTRTDADKHLAAIEKDVSVRQFLLTNLKVPSHHPVTGHVHKAKFLVPLDILSQSIDEIGSFPYKYDAQTDSAPVTWNGPTLAIKGSKSPYVNHKNLPVFRAFFPDTRVSELDTGHWVHAEKPLEFKKLVVNFLNGP